MKILLFIITGIAILFLLLIIYLMTISTGTIKPFTDSNGNTLEDSISEKIKVNINGVQQGMIIRGENIHNPVLLFVHGGPGVPQYFLNEYYPTDLEKHFTVCWWEQRGAGLSYNPNIPVSDLTVSQLVEDTAEVSRYLADRFAKEKIYLMAHSWGSFIGVQTAAKYPELYEAYIGMGQIADLQASEIANYHYLLDTYTTLGNTSKVKALESYDIENNEADLAKYCGSLLRDNSMHKLGVGTMHNMRSVITDIFFPHMTCHSYTLAEKFNFWHAKGSDGNSNLRNEAMYTNLNEQITHIDIPFYIFAGAYDRTVNYDCQKQFFDNVSAPVKGFYTFDSSAHSPLWEEPDTAIEILLQDVINKTITLSD